MGETNWNEQGYLDLLKNLLQSGNQRETRNDKVKSLFGSQLKFDLTGAKFPLLTTKKMFYRAIVEEQLFFLRGDTDSKILENQRVNIWKLNTTEEFQRKRGLQHYSEGDMGPMYGWQWRHYGAEYTGPQSNVKGEIGGFNQLTQLLSDIRTDPHSRRLLLTSYNPAQVKESVLAPCHSLVLQFYVDTGKNELSVHMYQRSADFFLGVPFNIAGTSIILKVIAHMLHMETGTVVISFGDYHLYSNHLEQAHTQVTREPLNMPKLEITREPPPVDAQCSQLLDWIDSLTFKDFKLTSYECHPAIKADMVA